MSQIAVEARRLIISGLVQGVGFRYHMAAAAKRLGVAGWVRNRSDGTVEAAIAGDGRQIAAMIDWATLGPSSARVGQVLVERVEEKIELGEFLQRKSIVSVT